MEHICPHIQKVNLKDHEFIAWSGHSQVLSANNSGTKIDEFIFSRCPSPGGVLLHHSESFLFSHSLFMSNCNSPHFLCKRCKHSHPPAWIVWFQRINPHIVACNRIPFHLFQKNQKRVKLCNQSSHVVHS